MASREHLGVSAETGRAGGRSSLCGAGGERGGESTPKTQRLDAAELSSSATFAQGRLTRCDHIRVAVRVRPLPPGEEGIIEVAGTGAIAIRKEAATGGNEALKSQQGRVEERLFNHVFGPEATQKEVYSWSCAPLVNEAVAKGRSATIFVYGATGAGKTHTMFGGNDREQQGLIFRAIPEVFEAIAHRQLGGEEGDSEADVGLLEVKVSFLEIYNEVVRDLLGGGGSQCRVLEDERKGVVKIANLVEATVKNPEEALWYLKTGMQVRTVEATAANQQSSRAHAVFSLSIESVRPTTTGSGAFARRGEVRTLHSKISLIDLAGSERAGVTQNSGAALKDGARINQSLLALANCIDALTAKGPNNACTPRKKPPYRDSKLTLMLKGSLVGDGLVAMIANVHPGRSHFEDSNNTLEYAKRASTVKTATPAARRISRAMTPASHEESIGQRREGTAYFGHCSGSGDEEQLDEGCIASSSSLPAPRATTSNLTRRRALDRQRAAAGIPRTVRAQVEKTITTSSHLEAEEECLSDNSLSGGEFETPEVRRDSDLEVEVECCTSPTGTAASAEEGSNSALSSGNGLGKAEDVSETEKENLHSPGRCGSTPARRGTRFGSNLQKREVSDNSNDIGADCILAGSNSAWTRNAYEAKPQESADMAIALRMINSLQEDKAFLDARLQSALKDLTMLETENRRLREMGDQKDRQLIQLLAERSQRT